MATVLRSASHCSQRDADRRARRAETLEALPAAADALARGVLTAEHVDVLGRAVEATSAEVVNDSNLIARATRRPADLIGRDTRDWIRQRRSDTDIEAAQTRRRDARRLSLWENDDGMIVVHGEYDPVTGAEIRARLDAEIDRLFHADGGRGRADQHRTPRQRRADALAGLVVGSSADRGGTPTPVRNQMLVMATLDTGDGEGSAVCDGRLVSGDAIPDTELERLACGADRFGLLLSEAGEPLWHGTRVRLATDPQWRALIARDGGCVICDAAPVRCEAHHVIAWQAPRRGPTDIDNLALLCRHHHHLVHDQRYQLRRTDLGWRLDPP